MRSPLKLFFFILAAIFLFFAIISSVKSCKEKNRENKRVEKAKQQQSQNTSSQQWEKVATKTIYFGPYYGEIVHLEKGKHISFEEATQPYCIMNSNNEEFCASKGGDPSLSRGSQNMELQFKSQNGNNGSVIITFWEKK